MTGRAGNTQKGEPETFRVCWLAGGGGRSRVPADLPRLRRFFGVRARAERNISLQWKWNPLLCPSVGRDGPTDGYLSVVAPRIGGARGKQIHTCTAQSEPGRFMAWAS